MKRPSTFYKRLLFFIIAVFLFFSFKDGRAQEVKKDPRIYLSIARFHTALDEFHKAVESYRTFLALNPREYDVRIEYARALFWSGKITECLDVINGIISVDGRKTDYLLEYGTVLAFSDRFAEAIEIYQEVLQREPSNFSAHLGLSFIYLRSASQSPDSISYRKKIDSLKEKFRFSIEEDKVSKEKISDRLKHEKTHLKGLGMEQIILELAYLKRDTGMYEESAAYFKEYLNRNDDPSVRIELARTYNWAKNLPSAIAELKTVLKRDKDNIRAMKDLALYESWAGDSKSAEKRFKYLLSLEPDNTELKLQRADNLRWAGQKDEAFAVYNEVYTKDPYNKRAREGMLNTSKLDYLIGLSKSEGLSRELAKAINGIHVERKDYVSSADLLSEYLAKDPKDLAFLEELAKTYSYMNEPSKAAAVCEKMLVLDAQNSFATENLPLFYLYSENYGKSVDAFKNLEAKKGLTLEQRLQFAQALKESGQAELAASHYLLVIKIQPNNEEAKRSLIEMGQTRFLEALFKREPKNRDIAQKLSDLYLADKDFKNAIRVLKIHCENDPIDFESRIKLARVNSWSGNLDESIRLFDELSKEENFENRDQALFGSAEVLSWKGDYTSALRRFNELLERNPENIEALTGLSKLYMWSGQREKEIEAYNTILKINPANMYALSMLERTQTHPSYKIADLEKRLDKNPSDRGVMKELIVLYEETADYEKALSLAEKLADMEPGDTEAALRVAYLKKKSSQDLTSRESIFTEEISKRPFSREPRKNYISYLIGAGQNEKAVKEMRSYLMLYPEDTDTREDLAKVLSWTGRYGESRREYEALLLERPGNHRYKVAMARIISWGGPQNYELAMELANDVISKDPGNMDAHIVRADIYSWSENYNKALKDYRTVLSKEKDHPDAKRGIYRILKPRYSVELGFLYKADNDDFSQLGGGLDIGVFWLKRFNSGFSYAHNLYRRLSNPDVNGDHIRFTQGAFLTDPLYLEAFIGYNIYDVSNNTLDYGASIKYNFGLRNYARIGYENTDILGDTFTYGSIVPDVIDSHYALLDFLYYLTPRTSVTFKSKMGFFSDTNRFLSLTTVFSYLLLRGQPLLSLYGTVKYLRLSKKLYTPSRYWDPSNFFSVVPGVYMEIDINRSIAYFADFRIGYGNEDGSSNLEIGTESGFLFRLASFSNLRLTGFYGQTGRELGNRDYYFYGAKAVLGFYF